MIILQPTDMVRSPVVSVFLVEGFFGVFSQLQDKVHENLGPHPSPDIIGRHTHKNIDYGCQWPLMLTRPETHIRYTVLQQFYSTLKLIQ